MHGNTPRKNQPGQGRKKGAYRLLRERIEAERVADANYAFALYVAVLRNEDESLGIRLAAADWVANRVLGKPKERLGGDGENGEIVFRVIYGNGDGHSATGAASETMGVHSQSG